MNFTVDNSECDKHFAVLFDSGKVEDAFKNIKCTVIKDREEHRIAAMVEDITKAGRNGTHFQINAITECIFPDSKADQLAMRLGMIKAETKALVLCHRCMDRAILEFEVHLNALRDLREATKDYATDNG